MGGRLAGTARKHGSVAHRRRKGRSYSSKRRKTNPVATVTPYEVDAHKAQPARYAVTEVNMPKTNAQRQAEYRARRATAGADNNGERKIAVWVDTSAALALERLARRYAVTQRQILERLLRDEDQKTLDQIPYNSDEWNRYFGLAAPKTGTTPDGGSVTQ